MKTSAGQGLLSPKACTQIGLLVNVGLAVFKLAAGLLGQSQAMLADSMHSFSDVAATGAVYLGLRVASRPPDQCHPYGHGGVDTLVAVGITLMLIATGLIMGLGAVRCLFGRAIPVPGGIALYAAVTSIAVKEALYRYAIKVGRLHDSPSVIANAYDHRSDAYSSVGALAGITAAKLGMPYFDPIASIFIAYLIVRMSIHLLKDYINEIVHAAPAKEFLDRIREVVISVEGVRDARNIRVHKVGPNRFLDIDVLVDGDISVTTGHVIATRVHEELKRRVDKVGDVMVHIEPYETEEEKHA